MKVCSAAAAWLSSLLLIVLKSRPLAARRDYYSNKRNIAFDQGRGRVLAHVARQLNAESVSTFCQDTVVDVESFVLNSFVDFFGNNVDLSFYPQDQGFSCVCDLGTASSSSSSSDDDDLSLTCSTMYGFVEEENNRELPFVSVEVMKFTKTNGTYHPSSAEWYDYYNGTVVNGESYTLTTPSEGTTPILESCTILGSGCPGATCGICEGGRTAFRLDPGCFSETCDDWYEGSFLFSYHLRGPVELTDDSDVVSCNTEDPRVGDFCANNLATIAGLSTVAFRSFFDPLENVTLSTDGYECVCVTKDSDTVAVQCALSYELQSNGGASMFTNNDTMTFSKRGNYFIPSSFKWCDASVDDPSNYLCEEYEMAFGQDDFSTCQINDCVPGFCELCADGSSVAYSCDTNPTCADDYTGSFLFPYRNLKLAVDECPPPTSTPTEYPTTSPTNSSTDSPTLSPASTLGDQQDIAGIETTSSAYHRLTKTVVLIITVVVVFL